MQTTYRTIEYTVSFRVHCWLSGFSKNTANFQSWVVSVEPKHPLSKSGSLFMHDFSSLCKWTSQQTNKPELPHQSLLFAMLLYPMANSLNLIWNVSIFDTADLFCLMKILSAFVFGTPQSWDFHFCRSSLLNLPFCWILSSFAFLTLEY